MRNKGQISMLQGLVVTLILVSVLITAGLLITQEFQEQDEFSDTSATVVNESGLFINQTPVAVARANDPGFNTFSVSQASNGTSGEGIDAGNFTVDADAGTIVNATEILYPVVNLTYTYRHGEESYLGVNNTLTSMLTIPSLLGVIILIALVGIILAVIFNVIPGARSSV